MEVYKFKNLDNGDILLEKVVLDNTNYTIVNKNNRDKILKKITNVNITDINDIKNMIFWNIIFCHVYWKMMK